MNGSLKTLESEGKVLIERCPATTKPENHLKVWTSTKI